MAPQLSYALLVCQIVTSLHPFDISVSWNFKQWYLGELAHAAIHLHLISLCCLCLIAGRLCFSGLCRYGGRSILSELFPSAANFVSLSACSFPVIPMCLAVHLKVILSLVLPCFPSWLMVWRIFAAMCCPSLVMLELTAFRVAWLLILITHLTL